MLTFSDIHPTHNTPWRYVFLGNNKQRQKNTR